MRSLRIGARGYVYDVLARLSGFGVKTLTSYPYPNFPFGFAPAVRLDYGGKGDAVHDCEAEPDVLLPAGTLVGRLGAAARLQLSSGFHRSSPGL